MKVFVFWLVLTLLPAIALATAGPSLAKIACSSLTQCRSDWLGTDGSNANEFDVYNGCQFQAGRGAGSGITCTNNPQEGQQQQQQQIQDAAENVQQRIGESDALCDPIGGTAGTGVETAIGCLAAGDPKLLISQLLGWGVGIGGGIAFLLIVYAGFQMTTAGGDPKRVQAARELLVSAISGLILIVFSIVLLNFIGFQVLNLPGFNVNLLNAP